MGLTDAAEIQQMVFDVDGQVPFRVEDVQLHVRWGLMPPLGKVPWKVQDVHDDVKLNDVLLEVEMYSKMRVFDAPLCDVVRILFKILDVMSLPDGVDKVDGLIDVNVLNSPTVLDEQGDVEANWCGLL